MIKNIVLITGGASGLGLEMVKIFLKKGFNVAVIDRDIEKINKMQDIKDSNINNLHIYAGDVRDEDFVEKTINQITNNYNIEYLINNAGVIWACHFSENTKERLDDLLGCAVGAMLVTAKVLPHMKKNDYGKIINVMSSAALLGKPLESMYCAAKFALRGFTNSLKAELKDTNIKVIGVYPGGINTPFYDKVRFYTPEEVSKKYMNATKLAEVLVSNCLQIDTLNVSSINIERL